MEGIYQNQHENQQNRATQITDIKEIKSNNPSEDKGKKKNKKNNKPRKRKRSAKQIERWNKYKENKYMNSVRGAHNDNVGAAECVTHVIPLVIPVIWPVIGPTAIPASHSVLPDTKARDERQVPIRPALPASHSVLPDTEARDERQVPIRPALPASRSVLWYADTRDERQVPFRPALPASHSVLPYTDTRDDRQVPDTPAFQNAADALQHSDSVFAVNSSASKQLMLAREQPFADTPVRQGVFDTLKEDVIPRASALSATHTGVVSKLSADAEVFVPGMAARFLQPGSDINKPAIELGCNLGITEEILVHPVDAESEKTDPQLRADADVFVPAGEKEPLDQISKKLDTPVETDETPIPLPEIVLHNTDIPAKDIMFGIMSVYTESGLHFEFDKLQMACSNTTKEDFGYEYFSISNLQMSPKI